ncbi:MCE family protein [Mycobacterium sp. SMC-4]|uniref:MCE family protein n=1 Tax=Mycobacterium sp. SMC-4 TaxID=2857059 RepID=UPI0021B485AD|nr:MCE family protein [Mycobacterium sp. SMC-4]UXA19814.1 MCE family protein [Mycobacterium sp. SMC-4]
MSTIGTAKAGIAAACSVVLVTTGCSFQGVNSLPLPGVVGRGSDAAVYHVQVSNVGTLETNSPVMVDDVIVGSVAKMTVSDWRANVEISVRPDVELPANVFARVGQTSLLGSMHIALDPPLGQAPQGRLTPGATIPISQSAVFPSTERTLSSVSTVVNAGGLGQIGDIIHSFNAALSGRESEARDILARLDRFVGVFDRQRGDVIASLQALDRLASGLVVQREAVRRALNDIPPALDVLIAQRAQFTTALEHLRTFSDITRTVVRDTQTDLVETLSNLDPTLRALADVGPDIGVALAFLPVMPFGQNLIDRGVRGDYMNLFAVMDLTVPRLKRTLFSGTRWGDPHALLVPAPGDPGYDTFYGSNPLTAPLAAPPADDPPPENPTPSEPHSAGPVPATPPGAR